MYKIYYRGAQENNMGMVYSVYKLSTFLFFKYYKICTLTKNNTEIYAEFDSLDEAQNFINNMDSYVQ